MELRLLLTLANNQTQVIVNNVPSPAIYVIKGQITSLAHPENSCVFEVKQEVKPHHDYAVTPTFIFKTLTRIELTPLNAKLALGTQVPFTATGIYSNDTSEDLTAKVTWSVKDPEVLSVNATGQVKGLKVGATEITATEPNTKISVSTEVTVTAAVLVSLQVTGEKSQIAKGLDSQCTATGLFSDNSTQDLTNQVTWHSSSANALVNSSGRVEAKEVGQARITASSEEITSAEFVITVTDAEISKVKLVEPTTNYLSLPLGAKQKIEVVATFSDSSTQDVTEKVIWQAIPRDNLKVVQFTPGDTFYVIGDVEGEASLQGAFQDSSGATFQVGLTVNVTEAVLQSLKLTPQTLTLPKGRTQKFIATGAYSDGSTVDLSNTVVWNSSDTAVSISNVESSKGLAKAEGLTEAGKPAQITATLGGIVSGAASVIATNAEIDSISIQPLSANVIESCYLNYRAEALYSDGSTAEVTKLADWHSSNPEIATIDNLKGDNNGRAYGEKKGSTVITASLASCTSEQAYLTVSPKIVTLTITPVGPLSLLPTQTQSFVAKGVFSDGTTNDDVTAGVNWVSSDSSVVSFYKSQDYGCATALATGEVEVYAKYLDAISNKVTIKVTP